MTTKRTKKTTATKPAKAAKPPAKRKRGRPAGSKTQDADVVLIAADVCQKCGSANREKYYGRTTTPGATGVMPDGRPFRGVEIRRTKCTDCGQARAVRFACVVIDVEGQ